MASTPTLPRIKTNSVVGRYQTAPGLQLGAACLPHASARIEDESGLELLCQQSAAKSLLLYLSTREAIGKLLAAGQGFDVPPFEKLDSPVWADAEPPKGTLYNFPPRGEVIVSVAGSPAPARIGVQMYAQGTMCKMIAQCTQQGHSIDEAITFGERELEGYMRT